MNKTVSMLGWTCVFAACRLASGADAPTIDRFALRQLRIESSVPVKVTLTDRPKVHKPTYRSTQGEWKDLPLTVDAAGVAFTQPADAVPATVILLDRPDWLVLPDETPPTVKALSIDGVETDGTGTVDLGPVAKAPARIEVTAEDAANPVSIAGTRVAIDGRPVDQAGGSVAFRQNGKALTADVRVGDLDRGQHVVTIALTDATPTANATTVEVRFNTAPLLRNGGFEEVGENGSPKHWSPGQWSSTPDTKAEITVVDGGHPGKALLFKGIAGGLNLVCGQPVAILPGRSYTLSGYYRNDGDRGGASIIGRLGGKEGQYDSMPVLKAAKDWTPFSWTFTARKGNTDFALYVRSGSVGCVWFDELKLEPKP